MYLKFRTSGQDIVGNVKVFSLKRNVRYSQVPFNTGFTPFSVMKEKVIIQEDIEKKYVKEERIKMILKKWNTLRFQK